MRGPLLATLEAVPANARTPFTDTVATNSRAIRPISPWAGQRADTPFVDAGGIAPAGPDAALAAGRTLWARRFSSDVLQGAA